MLRRPTFSALPEKVGKKRRWIRIGLYRSATEGARRRTLRPAHETLSTKLHYSAACVETTLPSGVVATQGNGKTRCCGMQNASTHAPVVHNICRADVGIGPYKPVSNIRTISYRESIGLAPVRASNKTRARQRAIYRVSSASFLPILFWQDRKEWSRGATVAALPQIRHFRCNRKRRMDSLVRPTGCGAKTTCAPYT